MRYCLLLGCVLWGAALLDVPVTSAQSTEPPIFTDVSRESGVIFTHFLGDDSLSSIVEATGAGCGFIDYDNDGDLDFYLLNGAYLKGLSDPRFRNREGKTSNQLFRNNGDGTFTDMTNAAGLGHKGYAMGMAAADYDNDGDVDIFVTNYGPNVLFRNNGDGTFSDVTKEAGVENDLFGVGCTFFDADNDGWLDLYVGNYVEYDPHYRYFYAPDHFPGPLSYKGQSDVFYRNNGDGTFSDVTQSAGLYNPDGRAMGVSSGDIDNDGDMDIVVANDAMANYLYRNNGDETFTDVAIEMGFGFGQSGEATSAMGPEIGDVDRDGFFDIFVPDMEYSCLYHNQRGEYFEERAAKAGLSAVLGQYICWGGELIDYDNDGWLDAFVVNGDAHKLKTEEDCLFRNLGGLRFEDVSAKSGDYFNQKYVGRGAASGDYDNDGDIDLLILNLNGPAVLLRNDGGNRNHWLKVKTVGTISNRDGIGAKVKVTIGDKMFVDEVRSGTGYLSMSDLRVHFGLSDARTVDRLEICWPSGIVQTMEGVAADRMITVVEKKE